VITDYALRPSKQLGSPLGGERIGGRIETAWRDWAKIDAYSTISARLVHHQMADSSEAATPRLDSGQRKSRGNDSIGRAATRF